MRISDLFKTIEQAQEAVRAAEAIYRQSRTEQAWRAYSAAMRAMNRLMRENADLLAAFSTKGVQS